jgi:hypothetical protein
MDRRAGSPLGGTTLLPSSPSSTPNPGIHKLADFTTIPRQVAARVDAARPCHKPCN